jgi:Cd2+/Zn2+-exporting ATPase
LFYARRITIDLLMTAAALGAVAIGASGEAATVVLLFTLGEALEGYSAARSRTSLKALLGLKPDQATVLRSHENDDGSVHTHYRPQPVAQLVPGDIVQVKAGERITCDGAISEGLSDIDESAITGEPIPVTKSIGDDVFAGTINGRGTLLIAVTRRADDFTIARIAQLVEQAQAQRSEAERFVDRFAQWYTPAVVLLAVAVAVLPPLLLGQPFLSPADGAPGWLYRGLALLIVACPCALIISIPVTVVSALTRLASLGVLVKGGAQLSALADAKVFAFDKTGTLTHGRPEVTAIRSRDCAHRETSRDDCAPCDDLVALAACVERGSSHPLAQAVIDAAASRQLQHRYDTATEITTHAGRGVTGVLNGRRLTVGHQALFAATPVLDDFLPDESLSDESLMLVGENDEVLGYMRVDDRIRPESATALQALKALDGRFRFVMLTGDRSQAADAVARQLSTIDEVQAGLMPEQKLDAVQALEARHGDVAMIGDGINDAPALARAKLGIAMGGAGSHQAMEVADIVLMNDDLLSLPLAVRLARKTARLVRQNIALSLGLKLAFLALAIPGLATLWMAVLADVGATVLVTMNGMRMLRAR